MGVYDSSGANAGGMRIPMAPPSKGAVKKKSAKKAMPKTKGKVTKKGASRGRK